MEFGTPDACTTCHEDKKPEWALEAMSKWGVKKGLEVRPWVEAIYFARKRVPGATERLLKVLADPKSAPYLRDSALDLLAAQPPEARVAPAVEPFTHDSSPWTRALALRAQLTNDQEHAARYRENGLRDPHAVVRMVLFPMFPKTEKPAAEELEADLADNLEWFQRPQVRELLRIAKGFAAAGNKARALQVFQMAERSGTPNELGTARLKPALMEIEGWSPEQGLPQ